MLRKLSDTLKTWVNDWLFSYKFEILKLNRDAKTPTRAYKHDAGFDLYVLQDTRIKPGEMVNVPTGIAVRSKRPLWFLLIGRSSTLLKYNLIVDIAVIDHNYTGELFVKTYNLGREERILIAGTRVAQIVPLPHTSGSFVEVNGFNIMDSDRGVRGFGSSGQ